jgi:hypothetical protein
VAHGVYPDTSAAEPSIRWCTAVHRGIGTLTSAESLAGTCQGDDDIPLALDLALAQTV